MANLSVLLNELEIVAEGLEDLISEAVFVGGATVPFYLDDPEKEEVRTTDDVDVVIEIASHLEYAKLEEKLALKGFEPDINSDIAVRKKYKNITVDVMASDASVWGFSNKWFPEGISRSTWIELPSGIRIRIFPVTYFLASKFEAYLDRAESIETSEDLEDILLIFHGNSTLELQVNEAGNTVRQFLAEQAKSFLQIDELEFRRICDCYRVSSSRIKNVCSFLCNR